MSPLEDHQIGARRPRVEMRDRRKQHGVGIDLAVIEHALRPDMRI